MGVGDTPSGVNRRGRRVSQRAAGCAWVGGKRLRTSGFPAISLEREKTINGKSRSSVKTRRVRRQREGFSRVEISVRKEDVILVRRVASALSDGKRENPTRALLQRHFVEPSTNLKALLAAAPLEGIDLERARDIGREIDL